MPELPEVEVVRTILERELKGLTMDKIHIYYDKIIEHSVQFFTDKLIGSTILSIERYGKYLVFIFDDIVMISHLRMEGKYYIKSHLDKTKHDHIVFGLSNGKYLHYHDTRKFGRFSLHSRATYLNEKPLSMLAKEPNNMDLKVFYKAIKNKNRAIKTLLLDQHIISGLGNIYVDETLFLSQVHPLSKGKDLDLLQTEKILLAAKKTLDKAIALGGTTIRSYTSSLGVTGLFQNELNVHTKKRRPCPVCGTPILKIKVGGRGTYFCPKCQHKPLIIGLTGGIATGKSTATTYLKEKGFKVIDSDLIVKDLYETDQKMIKEIEQAFNLNYQSASFKSELSQLIFSDEKNRLTLNKIVHKRVFAKIDIMIKKYEKQDIIFIDMPLLFEVSYQAYCDKTVLIYAKKTLQIERLMIRDHLNYEQAIKRVESQMAIDEKLKIANYVIDNNTSIIVLKKQIDKLIEDIRK